MHFVWKLLLANAVIVASVQLGRRFPAAAGLIATMPLTTLIVLVWLHSEAPGNQGLLVSYTRGVLWGILPSLAFFLAALWLFHRQTPFGAALGLSSAVWLLGAFAHRWLVR